MWCVVVGNPHDWWENHGEIVMMKCRLDFFLTLSRLVNSQCSDFETEKYLIEDTEHGTACSTVMVPLLLAINYWW